MDSNKLQRANEAEEPEHRLRIVQNGAIEDAGGAQQKWSVRIISGVDLELAERVVRLRIPLNAEEDRLLRWYIENAATDPKRESSKLKKAEKLINGYALNIKTDLDLEAILKVHCEKHSGSPLYLDIEAPFSKDGPTLHSLHWEILERASNWDSDSGSSNIIVRRIVLDGSTNPEDGPEKSPSESFNILLVSARDTSKVDDYINRDYHESSLEVAKLIRRLPEPQKERIHLEIVRPGTFLAFKTALESHDPGFYNIVHLDIPERVSEWNDLLLDFVSGNDFSKVAGTNSLKVANMLAEFEVELVVLNTNKTGSSTSSSRKQNLAQQFISAGLPAAVVTTYNLLRGAAGTFVGEFYTRLLGGASAAVAAHAARRKLQENILREPVPGIRAEVDDYFVPGFYCTSTGRGLNPLRATDIDTIQLADAQKLKLFVGRDLDIRRIESQLLSEHTLCVSGRRFSGKTALFKHLSWWWPATSFARSVHVIDFAGVKVNDKPLRDFADLVEYLYSTLFEEAGSSLKLNLKLTKIVARLRTKKDILVLDPWDAFYNDLKDEDKAQLDRVCTRLKGGSTKVIKVLQMVPKDTSGVFCLPPIGRNHMAELFHKRFGRYISHIDLSGENGEVFDKVLELLEGLPGTIPLLPLKPFKDGGDNIIPNLFEALHTASLHGDSPWEASEYATKLLKRIFPQKWTGMNRKLSERMMLTLAPFWTRMPRELFVQWGTGLLVGEVCVDIPHHPAIFPNVLPYVQAVGTEEARLNDMSAGRLAKVSWEEMITRGVSLGFFTESTIESGLYEGGAGDLYYEINPVLSLCLKSLVYSKNSKAIGRDIVKALTFNFISFAIDQLNPRQKDITAFNLADYLKPMINTMYSSMYTALRFNTWDQFIRYPAFFHIRLFTTSAFKLEEKEATVLVQLCNRFIDRYLEVWNKVGKPSIDKKLILYHVCIKSAYFITLYRRARGQEDKFLEDSDKLQKISKMSDNLDKESLADLLVPRLGAAESEGDAMKIRARRKAEKEGRTKNLDTAGDDLVEEFKKKDRRFKEADEPGGELELPRQLTALVDDYLDMLDDNASQAEISELEANIRKQCDRLTKIKPRLGFITADYPHYFAEQVLNQCHISETSKTLADLPKDRDPREKMRFGQLELMKGKIKAANDAFIETIKLAKAARDEESERHTQGYLLVLSMFRKDWAKAIEHCDRYNELMKKLPKHNRPNISQKWTSVYIVKVVCLMKLKRWAEAETEVDHVAAILEPELARDRIGVVHQNMFGTTVVQSHIRTVRRQADIFSFAEVQKYTAYLPQLPPMARGDAKIGSMIAFKNLVTLINPKLQMKLMLEQWFTRTKNLEGAPVLKPGETPWWEDERKFQGDKELVREIFEDYPQTEKWRKRMEDILNVVDSAMSMANN